MLFMPPTQLTKAARAAYPCALQAKCILRDPPGRHAGRLGLHGPAERSRAVASGACMMVPTFGILRRQYGCCDHDVCHNSCVSCNEPGYGIFLMSEQCEAVVESAAVAPVVTLVRRGQACCCETVPGSLPGASKAATLRVARASQVSKSALTAVRLQENGRTMAVGAGDGSTTVLRLSAGLADMQANEKPAFLAVMMQNPDNIPAFDQITPVIRLSFPAVVYICAQLETSHWPIC